MKGNGPQWRLEKGILLGGQKCDISLHFLQLRGSLLYVKKLTKYSKDTYFIILLTNTSWSQFTWIFKKFLFWNIMSNTP
jgi:hypothetical protein